MQQTDIVNSTQLMDLYAAIFTCRNMPLAHVPQFFEIFTQLMPQGHISCSESLLHNHYNSGHLKATNASKLCNNQPNDVTLVRLVTLVTRVTVVTLVTRSTDGVPEFLREMAMLRCYASFTS